MSFHLKHYQEFEKILKSYRVSNRAKKTLEGLNLVLMLAATSTGRNTLIKHLVETRNYHYIVSDTTRPPRTNDGVLEQNGKEYWFRTEEQVLEDLRKGEYLEAELIHQQQVSGMSIRELEKAKAQGKVAVTDIDIQGMHNVIMVKPDIVPILLLPPNFEEWQKRIQGRGQMSDIDYQRRMHTAQRVFADGLEQPYYQFVVTEDVEQSVTIIDNLARGGPNPHQGRGKQLIKELQQQIEHYLEHA
jgi:guanylate kinase